MIVKCLCQHCEGQLEFESDDLTEENSLIVCPLCGQQTKLNLSSTKPRRGRGASRLKFLTAETIRKKTKIGDTPVHRASKEGRILEIPAHLLTIETLLEKNNEGYTPLHVAAKYGHLSQIPRHLLVAETLTVCSTPRYAQESTYTTASGYVARTETPLHVAVRCGNADQIPSEFFVPEYLSIPATGYRLTVLHQLAQVGRLDLVPESYADSPMWNLLDFCGRTPRDISKENANREARIAIARAEPATEKQKEKLRWFGCTWDEGITKGQASDALDACAKHFPERNAAYYSRPATEEQLSLLRPYFAKYDETAEDYADGDFLTYGEAKELIRDYEQLAQTEELDAVSSEDIETDRVH